MPHSFAELKADTAILIAELGKRNKGDTIAYEEIEKVIGWDVRNNRGIISTVKNRLLRDHGLILDVVPKVGYRVLTDKEATEGALARDRERRRRSAVRSKRKAQAIDMNKLTEQQKLRCLAEITAAHVTVEASTDKSVAQIGSTLNGGNQPLALNNALEALKRNL